MSGRRKNGFTLLEMLVVVAVIAVLAALLLPALKAARDRAKTVDCASNERQIGAGFSAFLQDHNGFYPYSAPAWGPINATNGAGGWNGTKNWTRQLAPYLSPADADVQTHSATYRRLMQCRANPWPFPDSSTVDWATGGNLPRSYQMNNNFFPPYVFIVEAVGNFNPTIINVNKPEWWLSRIKLSSIRYPSQLSLVGEIPFTSTSANAYGAPLPLANHGHDPYGGFRFNSWTSLAVTGVNYLSYWRRTDTSNHNSAFHNFGANVLFVDGHVEWLSKKKLFAYSEQYEASWSTTPGLPGNIFWTDNKRINTIRGQEYQFPAAPWPWDP